MGGGGDMRDDMLEHGTNTAVVYPLQIPGLACYPGNYGGRGHTVLRFLDGTATPPPK